MKTSSQIISELDQKTISTIEKSNSYLLEIEGESFDLTLEDFEIQFEDIPGWQVAVDRDITVALDTTLTPELEAEGMACELVNRIQNIRKNSDFNVTDRIRVEVEDHEAVRDAIRLFGTLISNEVLADSLTLGAAAQGDLTEIDEELSVKIAVNLVK